MKTKYLKGRFKDIEDNIAKVENANLADPELIAMLSSYLVVFISGVYEDCIEFLFVYRAGKGGDRQIESLVKRFLHRHFRNPEYDKILDLVNALDARYATRMRSKVPPASAEGINSIVNNKNRVAHGESSNATLKDVRVYHDNASVVFHELERILVSGNDA